MADVPFSTFVTDLALDTAGGAEKLPVVDGSTPKYVTVDTLKTYIIAALTAASAITPTTGDALVVERAGTEGTFDLDALAAYIVDYLEAITTGTTIVSGDKVIYSDGGVLKQIDIDTIVTFVNSENGTLGAQIAALSAATLADTDQYILAQSSTAWKTTFADIAARVHSQISTYIAALAAVTTPADSDKLYILQGSTAKYLTLTVLANTYLAAELNLQSLQWPTSTTTPSAAGDKLLMERSGTISEVDIDTLVTYAATGLQDAVLTFSTLAAATPNAADLFALDDSGTPKKITLTNLETKLWADYATYVTNLTAVATVTANDKIPWIQGGTPMYVTPVELATYLDVGVGDVTGPVITTEDNIPQWDDDTKELKDGLTLVTTVRETGSAVDTAVPTEQAVREAVAGAATAAIDIDGQTAIGEALNGTDLFLVDHGADGTNRSSAISRIKTYIETAGTYDNFYVDAVEMVACTTNPAAAGQAETSSNLIERKYFAFDGGATEERVQFRRVMPEDWDRGDVRVKLHWSSASGSSIGDLVEWQIKAVAIGNDDVLDATWGNPSGLSDALLAVNGGDLQTTQAIELAVGGSPQLGDMIVFEIYRHTAGLDDMTEDAWLFGVEFQYQKNKQVAVWSPAVSSSPSGSPSTSPSASTSASPSASPSSSPSTSPSASPSSSPSSSPSAT
jgi:hypothetical protein